MRINTQTYNSPIATTFSPCSSMFRRHTFSTAPRPQRTRSGCPCGSRPRAPQRGRAQTGRRKSPRWESSTCRSRASSPFATARCSRRSRRKQRDRSPRDDPQTIARCTWTCWGRSQHPSHCDKRSHGDRRRLDSRGCHCHPFPTLPPPQSYLLLFFLKYPLYLKPFAYTCEPSPSAIPFSL